MEQEDLTGLTSSQTFFFFIFERPGLTRKIFFFSTGLTSLGHNLQDRGLTIYLFTRELAVIVRENLGKLTANLT